MVANIVVIIVFAIALALLCLSPPRVVFGVVATNAVTVAGVNARASVSSSSISIVASEVPSLVPAIFHHMCN